MHGIRQLLVWKKKFFNSPWDKGDRKAVLNNKNIFNLLKNYIRGFQWMLYKGFIHSITGRFCKSYVEPIATYSNGKNGQFLQAIFYKEKTLEVIKDFKIKALMPCIFMFEEKNGRGKITLCDPLFEISLKSIKILITKPIVGKAVRKKKEWYEIEIKSAQHPYIGRPVTTSFKLA